MNLKDALSYALDKLLGSGMDHAEGVINESEKKELNIESGKISLFRTQFLKNNYHYKIDQRKNEKT